MISSIIGIISISSGCSSCLGLILMVVMIVIFELWYSCVMVSSRFSISVSGRISGR